MSGADIVLDTTEGTHYYFHFPLLARMKKQPLPRRIDESNPESYRRYKKWLASRAYNERNREARNAKKRERMAALRAKQKLDPPIVQVARLAAKEESARKYRERNRSSLALKAAVARSNARWDRQLAEHAAILLSMRQRNHLDRALWELEPTESDQE